MSKSTRIPALAKIAARLEAMTDPARRMAESAVEVKDARLALDSLLLACRDALDALAAIGGRPTLDELADVGPLDC